MRPTIRLLAKFLEPGTPTGLTGLLTHPAPRSTLIYLYSSTLNKLKTVPEHSPYRQATEALTKKRLEVVEATKAEGYDAWLEKVRGQIAKHKEKLGGAELDQRATAGFDPLSYEGREFVAARMFTPVVDERDKAAEWNGEGEGRPTLEGPRTRAEKEKEVEDLWSDSLTGQENLPEIDPEPRLSREEIHDMEQKIGAGLIEEVIQVAEGELKLVDIMVQNRVWEELSEPPPEGQWSYFERAARTQTQKP